MHPAVVYTLGRIALFGAVAVVLYMIGLDPLIVMLGALVISMPLSWFVLRGPRDAWAGRISGSAERRKQRQAEMDRQLDEEWDRQHSEDLQPDVAQSEAQPSDVQQSDQVGRAESDEGSAREP